VQLHDQEVLFMVRLTPGRAMRAESRVGPISFPLVKRRSLIVAMLTSCDAWRQIVSIDDYGVDE
jgi:hypothetical protein